MADNDYAVVVGINHYPNEPLADLEGPENDAEGFKKWLLSPTGGAIPDDGKHVHLILSHDFTDTGNPLSAKPTTEEVDQAFEEIIGQVSKPPARRLYMFFAGHGIAPQMELGDAALLMANAGRGRMGHNIPGQMYAESLRAPALFQEIVLVMDCCRDNYPRARVHNPPWDMEVRMDAANVRTLLAFATKWSRKSREKPIDDPKRVEGIFSHAVLAALNSGRLTGSQFKNLVINYVKMLVQDNEYQEPVITLDPNGEIVFSEAAPPARLSVNISFTEQTLGHDVELEDGEFKNCFTHEATTDTWQIDLEPGTYRIRDRVTAVSKIFKVLGGDVIDVQF